jgi:hypothetical protein
VNNRARLVRRSFRAQTICVDLRVNVDGGDARGGWRRETEIGCDHKSVRLTTLAAKLEAGIQWIGGCLAKLALRAGLLGLSAHGR